MPQPFYAVALNRDEKVRFGKVSEHHSDENRHARPVGMFEDITKKAKDTKQQHITEIPRRQYSSDDHKTEDDRGENGGANIADFDEPALKAKCQNSGNDIGGKIKREVNVCGLNINCICIDCGSL